MTRRQAKHPRPSVLNDHGQSQENEPTLPSRAPSPSQKRPRTSPPQSPIKEHLIKDTISENAPISDSGEEINPLEYWRRELRWPKEYFEPESNMNHLLSSKLLEAGSTTPSFTTPSDQKPREVKSSPYQRWQYECLLEARGSFMCDSELGITDTNKTVCQTLLEAEQIVPEDSLFRDDLFDKTCRMIKARNEAKVIQDIARLIVPSAESLAVHGAKHLEPLIESVNEGWNNSIALIDPRPQPDYAVGFQRTAFTKDQLKKIQLLIGGLLKPSFYMGTRYMYFPFLTCEAKCGDGALNVADRQNAHSMTLAVRGIVQLFRLLKREKELHRQILAFSISHNNQDVRIYGHYPMIDGKETTFHIHEIHNFNFTSHHGMEKWTAYKFTKNVYDKWMPTHLERIRLAINELPSDPKFEVSEQSALPDTVTQTSVSEQIEVAEQIEVVEQIEISEQIEERAPKRARKRGRLYNYTRTGKID